MQTVRPAVWYRRCLALIYAKRVFNASIFEPLPRRTAEPGMSADLPGRICNGFILCCQKKMDAIEGPNSRENISIMQDIQDIEVLPENS